MSKSLGNLVFVHKLVEAGVDPSAIRLGVYAGHYRGDRDWSDEVLGAAQERLTHWRAAAKSPRSVESVQTVIQDVRAALADDLDTPRALETLDAWAAEAINESADTSEESTADAASVIRTAVNSLLGVRL